MSNPYQPESPGPDAWAPPQGPGRQGTGPQVPSQSYAAGAPAPGAYQAPSPYQQGGQPGYPAAYQQGQPGFPGQQGFPGQPGGGQQMYPGGQQTYPSGPQGHPGAPMGGQQPYQQGPPPGQAQFVLDLKYFPLAFIFMLIKPKIVINGHEVPAQWGRNVIPVPPGHHHVHVHVPYFLPSQVGPADVQVPLQQGQTAELEYRAPVFAFARGAMGYGPQQWNGVGITIAVMVLPIALFFLLAMCSAVASA
ncbi:MAG: hypothetical protein ACRDOO_12245 [Actinomadura sp.]